jgi:hypothetical protein
MTLDSKAVECANCGRILEESMDILSEDRAPCPGCGSLARNTHITIHDIGMSHEKLGLKSRYQCGGRPFLEQVVGEDLHRRSDRWMIIHRIIDRVKDWYSEKVIDPETGQVVHSCEEPLSKHQGHGSARRKK